MKVIIMGCGRVGISVASTLDDSGHDVTVIDRDPKAFRSLPSSFNGKTVRGVGFDLDTLNEAGINQADVFISVSSGDNSNIISARVAREKFNVPKVIARIYDPKRAEIYGRLGIPTIASVAWSTQQIISLINNVGATTIWSDSENAAQIISLFTPNFFISKSVAEIELQYSLKIVLLTRNSKSELARPESIIQDEDLLHIAFLSTDEMKLRRVLNSGEVN